MKEKTQREHPYYLRDEVVRELGENDQLPCRCFLRPRHIMDAYGLTEWSFRRLRESGVLQEKFLFNQGG